GRVFEPYVVARARGDRMLQPVSIVDERIVLAEEVTPAFPALERRADRELADVEHVLDIERVDPVVVPVARDRAEPHPRHHLLPNLGQVSERREHPGFAFHVAHLLAHDLPDALLDLRRQQPGFPFDLEPRLHTLLLAAHLLFGQRRQRYPPRALAGLLCGERSIVGHVGNRADAVAPDPAGCVQAHEAGGHRMRIGADATEGHVPGDTQLDELLVDVDAEMPEELRLIAVVLHDLRLDMRVAAVEAAMPARVALFYFVV